MGGGANISSFSKRLSLKEIFVKYRQGEALRPQAGASRKGNIVLIMPPDPAYPALAGRGTVRPRIKNRPWSTPSPFRSCACVDHPQGRGTAGAQSYVRAAYFHREEELVVKNGSQQKTN